MAILKILTEEEANDILRKTSKPVTEITPKIETLLNDMKDTLIKAGGVGLAAVQVGILRRIYIIDAGVEEDKHEIIEFINPEIIAAEGTQEDVEGCLSVPGRRGMVKRPMKVRAKFQDRNGEWYEIEAEELLARCIMHETDHLDGKLYVDIMSRELFDEDDGEETEE